MFYLIYFLPPLIAALDTFCFVCTQQSCAAIVRWVCERVCEQLHASLNKQSGRQYLPNLIKLFYITYFLPQTVTTLGFFLFVFVCAHNTELRSYVQLVLSRDIVRWVCERGYCGVAKAIESFWWALHFCRIWANGRDMRSYYEAYAMYWSRKNMLRHNHNNPQNARHPKWNPSLMWEQDCDFAWRQQISR